MASVAHSNDAANELLRLWEKYHEDYVETRPEYDELIARKKKLGLRLDELNKVELRERWPNINFLRIKLKESAIDNIQLMSQNEIKSLISLIKREIEDNYSFYQKMRKTLRNYRNQIRGYYNTHR